MKFSRHHVRVLAALADTQRTGAVTAPAVAVRAGLQRRTARGILRTHVRRGLAVQLAGRVPGRVPGRWVITGRGLAVVNDPRYGKDIG